MKLTFTTICCARFSLPCHFLQFDLNQHYSQSMMMLFVPMSLRYEVVYLVILDRMLHVIDEWYHAPRNTRPNVTCH